MAGSARSARTARKRGSRKLSNLLLALGIVLLVAAGGIYGYIQWRYHQVDEENEKLASYAEVSEVPDDVPQVDWAGLKAINDEVVAWLYVPGTTINYPVYQTTDNDHYLHYNAEGVYGVGGQIFLDREDQRPGMVDQQSILYGHHLRNGTMFEQIAAMDQQETFDQLDTVWYVTEDGAVRLEPLLMYYSRADDQTVRQFDFATVEDYHAYLEGLLAKAVTKRPDAERIVGGTSHVLSLVTCNYYKEYYMEDGTNGRSILVCVPKEEADAVLASAS